MNGTGGRLGSRRVYHRHLTVDLGWTNVRQGGRIGFEVRRVCLPVDVRII